MGIVKNRWFRRVAALVLVILAVWFLANRLHSNSVAAQEEKVRAMSREMTADFSLEKIKDLKKRDPSKETERKERMAKLRAESEKLPKERRRAVQMQMGSEMMSKFADSYWKMPKAQQDAGLNAMIDLMEAGRKQQQQRPNDNANQDPERRRPRTDEERFEWFKNFLNNTTPEDRAKLGEMFRRMNELRQVRGLPPLQPGRPRRAN
jgi:hypothetical protein